jgi:hypothetical protein
MVAVTLIVTLTTAPAANQYALGYIVQNGNVIQGGFYLGIGGSRAVATAVFPADASVAWSYGAQLFHNLAAAQNITTTLHAYRVGL